MTRDAESYVGATQEHSQSACEFCDGEGCPGCCAACQEATGGRCPKHYEPECTCYEGPGHQPGCQFARSPR
jgi:hypothetical protein